MVLGRKIATVLCAKKPTHTQKKPHCVGGKGRGCSGREGVKGGVCVGRGVNGVCQEGG